jgi:hypothetical protein
MEIADALQLFIEIGLDGKSEYSICSSDFKQHYDYKRPDLLLNMMNKMGIKRDVAALAIKLHLTPIVTLHLDDFAEQLPPRSRGVLTGSKSASLLATLPIIDAIIEKKALILFYGIRFNSYHYHYQQKDGDGDGAGCNNGVDDAQRCSGSSFDNTIAVISWALRLLLRLWI